MEFILRKITRPLLILFCLSAFTFPAQAGSAEKKKKNLCHYYSTLGSSSAAFMLPMRFEQIIAMFAGRDRAMMAAFTDHIMNSVKGKDLHTASTLSDEENDYLSESAGDVAVELLMTGKAITRDEVFNRLNAHCLRIGPMAIIANQKAAAALTSIQE